jgi:hypothetical protein
MHVILEEFYVFKPNRLGDSGSHSALMTEAVSTSEISVTFYQTAWANILANNHLHMDGDFVYTHVINLLHV